MRSTDELIAELEGTDSGAGYEFEDANLPASKLEMIKPELLTRKLSKIVAQVQGARCKEDYENVRGKYIALHKGLNELGKIAPRFRPSLVTATISSGNRCRSDNLISNDHQVLDLHWLAKQAGFDESRIGSTSPRWSAVFCSNNADGLDHEAASLFAGTAGSADNKADILELSVFEQLELRTIQTEAVRAWWARHREDWREVRIAIRAAARSQPSLVGRERKWADGWLATTCATYAGGSAVNWFEMINGETIADSTLSHIKKRVPKLSEYRAVARGAGGR